MIPTTIVAGLVAMVAYFGGVLMGGIDTVEKLADAERERDEYARRLNRILETDQRGDETEPLNVLLYAVARGAQI